MKKKENDSDIVWPLISTTQCTTIIIIAKMILLVVHSEQIIMCKSDKIAGYEEFFFVMFIDLAKSHAIIIRIL